MIFHKCCPIFIHPSFLWSVLQICRWGTHSSRAATSLGNSHGTHAHNQEFRSSLGSYIHPANSIQHPYVSSENGFSMIKWKSTLTWFENYTTVNIHCITISKNDNTKQYVFRYLAYNARISFLIHRSCLLQIDNSSRSYIGFCP